MFSSLSSKLVEFRLAANPCSGSYCSLNLWVGCRGSRIGGKDLVEDRIPGTALGVAAGCCAHGHSICWMIHDVGNGSGEVFVVDDAARSQRRGSLGGAAFFAARGCWRDRRFRCGAKDVGGASVRGDDGRDAAGQGFEDYVPEGVGVGGEDEEIHVGVGDGEGFAAEDAGELCFG